MNKQKNGMKRVHDSGEDVEAWSIPHKRFQPTQGLTEEDRTLINTLLPGQTREAFYEKIQSERTKLSNNIRRLRDEIRKERKGSKRVASYENDIWILEKRKEGLVSSFIPVFMDRYRAVRGEIRDHQGVPMDVCMVTTPEKNMSDFFESQPFSSAAIFCVMDELKQKGWKSDLRFVEGVPRSEVRLVCDFTQ